jgi:hypothetical protein
MSTAGAALGTGFGAAAVAGRSLLLPPHAATAAHPATRRERPRLRGDDMCMTHAYMT